MNTPLPLPDDLREASASHEPFVVRLPSLEIELELCELRGSLWRALHGEGEREQAVRLLRACPNLARGSMREWAGLKEACRARLMGASQPCAPDPEVQRLTERINAQATLGLRVTRDGADEFPLPQGAWGTDGEGLQWSFSGHWFLDALLFGAEGELQGLLDAGIDPNVQQPRETRGEPDAPENVPLDAWSYCLSLVLMRDEELGETGIAGSPAAIRQAAGRLLERCLLHGLRTTTLTNPNDPTGRTRGDQLAGMLQRNRDAGHGWVARWIKAAEEYELCQAAGGEPLPSLRPFRPRL